MGHKVPVWIRNRSNTFHAHSLIKTSAGAEEAVEDCFEFNQGYSPYSYAVAGTEPGQQMSCLQANGPQRCTTACPNPSKEIGFGKRFDSIPLTNKE